MSYTAEDFTGTTRVQTQYGLGTVQYIRMKPPTYATVEAVSVLLDGRRDLPGYMGTILNVEGVHILKNEPSAPSTPARDPGALAIMAAERCPRCGKPLAMMTIAAIARDPETKPQVPELIHEVDLGKHGDGQNIGVTSRFAAALQLEGVIYTRQCITTYALVTTLDDDGIKRAIERILNGD